MRRIALTLALGVALLAGCVPATTPAPSATAPAPPATLPPPTPTALPPTPTPIPTATADASLPCAAPPDGYCILDGSFILLRPIAAPGTFVLDRSYPYGSTLGGTRDPHHGVEFQNSSGTPVLAAAAGSVVYAGDDSVELFSPWSGYYGNLVVLEHPLPDSPYAKLYTLYAHLSAIDVVTGQRVEAGQPIGRVGLSGTALGSHLHFEVRLDPRDFTTTLNPDLWLVPVNNEWGHPSGAIAIRVLDGNGNFVPAEISLQLQGEPHGTVDYTYAVESYAAETLNPENYWYENAAMGDLLAAHYRIAFVWGGAVHERYVVVEPGRLTLAVFQLP